MAKVQVHETRHITLIPDSEAEWRHLERVLLPIAQSGSTTPLLGLVSVNVIARAPATDGNSQYEAAQAGLLDTHDGYYVEWRLPDREAPTGAYLSKKELDKRILNRIDDFAFLLDERTGEIRIATRGHKSKTARHYVSVSPDALQKRHKIFLGLILRALKTRAPISYATIARKTYGECVDLAPNVKDNIRRTLSALNGRLWYVFKNVVKAERGMDQYLVSGDTFCYCWIRYDKGKSVLFKER